MAPAIRAQNLCVLFFERPEHPFFTKMQNLFQNAPHTQFIPLAKPIDFLNCVQSQASEILIVAHSFEVSYVGSSSTKLGFFLPLSPEAAAKNQAQTITALHQALTAEKKHSHCFRPLDGKGPKRCPPRLQSLKRALQLVTRADPGSDLYQLLFAYEKGLFLDKPFELTLQWMRENPQSLTKIRLMSCDPQKIFKAYPAFQQIIAQFSIELDVAPTDWLLSLFSPHPVTSYDEDWVKKSLQPF
jgi:hypothetical protein